MTRAVQYTTEFGDWWAGLAEGEQEDITAVVELLAETARASVSPTRPA